MLHRKLYTIGILLALLVFRQGFFAANAEETANFCNPSTAREFEHIIACYHLKINDITNKQIANLKLFHEVINPNRQPDLDLPTLNSLEQKDLMGPVTHYSNSAEQKDDLVELCTNETKTITNIHPQCLLTLSLDQFYESKQEIIEFMNRRENQAQQLKYQTYWLKHQDDIIEMLQANVVMYNQMFMSYPIHENILKMQNQAQLIIDELDKTADIIKHIPNKFDNASTTECI